MPRLSVVIPTLQREREVRRLLDSLRRQRLTDFEVILVDQNPDNRLDNLVQEYAACFPFQHFKVQFHGASRARNWGSRYASGEVLLWPDDDSWLPEDFLKRLSQTFETDPETACVVGILVDETGRPHQRWIPQGRQIATIYDAFVRAAEPVIFCRRAVFNRLGGFDEQLGTGAQTRWGAGEGTDFCVRVVKAGGRMLIDPDLRVQHARPAVDPGSREQREKAYRYACGMGAVVKKNRIAGGMTCRYFFTYIRALLWNVFRFRWKNAGYHWERIRGLWTGWSAYPGDGRSP